MPDDNIPSQKYRGTSIPRYFVVNFFKIARIARKTKTLARCRAYTLQAESSKKAFTSDMIIEDDLLYLMNE